MTDAPDGTDDRSATETDDAQPAEAGVAATSDAPPGQRVARADATEVPTAESEGGGFALRGVLWVGVVLAAAFVVLFGATFLVLRPK
jgi:uncharacterized membrane protein